MPRSCVAVGCTNHQLMGKDISFHIFPNKTRKKEKWEKWVLAMKRINADGTPWYPGSNYVYVCSEHFQTGRPSADPDHPNYVQNIFKFKKCDNKKNKLRLQRYESAKKRAKYERPVPPDMENFEEEAVENDSYNTVSTLAEVTMNEEIEVGFLRAEKNHLITKLSCAEQQVLLSSYNPDVIKDNDAAAKYLTGLSSTVFQIVSDSLLPYLADFYQSKLPHENQIVLVLVRLRLNLPFQYLS